MKILLSSCPPEDLTHSIECGMADGISHFDHHKPAHRARAFPSPCADERIHALSSQERRDAQIGISHFDADTAIGLRRLLGLPLPDGIDISLIEIIDNRGSSALPDLGCDEYAYALGMSGASPLVRGRVPRCGAEPIDVTEGVLSILAWPCEIVVATGKVMLAASEETYHARCEKEERTKHCRYKVEPKGRKVGLWILPVGESIDPSRPYRDGFSIAVVFRHQFETISIYSSPDAKGVDILSEGKARFAGIDFEGHPRACGSAPRDRKCSIEEAVAVFEELRNIF